KKPRNKAYPDTLKIIGDHLRKKRLDLKLRQKDVGSALKVDAMTICNWEKNRGQLALRFIPKIISFLGYDPFPQVSSTLGAEILQYRRKQGLSIKKLAKILGIDP